MATSGSLAHLRGLIATGDYQQAPGRHPAGRTIPVGQELVELVTAGRGWVEHEGVWIELTPGAIAWQCAGDRTIARSDFIDPYRCFTLAVHVVPGSPRPAPRVTRWEDVDEARAFVREVLRHGASGRADRDALAHWAYGRLLLQAKLAAAGGTPLPAPLGRALRLIDDRWREGVTLDQLARAAGWSSSHLHAAFRSHLGTSPHRYLLARRLRAARELLAATAQPVAAVATACGFADAAAFCRAFRAAVGTSPAAWRRQQR